MTSRRNFLSLLAASTAACRIGPNDGPDARATASAEPGAIDVAAIEATERVMGVRYTAAEREQIVATMEEQLGLITARHGHVLDNGLGPATVFDPRLPSTTIPTAQPLRLEAVERPLPDSEDDIAFASVAEQSQWLGTGVLSSRRLTEIYLERLGSLGPALHCVITRLDESALAQADRADAERAAGRVRGPLQGIPWGAKDLFDTKGVATTWGAKPFADRVPERNATVVARLEKAGAVLLAKLSLGALAYGDQWFGGRTRNPWNPEEGSSGSSAGSAAAVAAGLCSFALGTETLGSIVSPSMRCGVTGLRPTFGRIGRSGAMALCWSMDKIGPLTRTVEDSAMVLAAINGPDDGDPSSRATPLALDLQRPLSGLRVGIVPGWFADPELTEPERDLPSTLRSLGVEVVELPSLPDLPYAAMYTILYAEAAAAFEAMTLSNTDDELVWQEPEAWPNSFRRARLLSAIELVQAQRIRREVMEVMAARFATVDVMAGPSFAGGMLLATNMTGHPSLTLRAGFVSRAPLDSISEEPSQSPDRPMPVGITLWGRLYDEGTLCRVGLALQRHFGVVSRRPPTA